MNKNIRRILAVVLALVIVLGTVALVSAGSNLGTIENVNQAYAVAHNTELINVYKASLCFKGVWQKDVYYVVCRGLDVTELDFSKPRSIASAIQIGLSDEDNAYVNQLVASVRAAVPAGADVIFMGHSMGGMVIEQAIAKDELKDNYNILYSLAIGSPYILTSGEKEGKLIRAVDNLDPIPFLSIPALANPFMGDTITETSFQFGLIHFKSYEKGSCWGKYDALGFYRGKGKAGYSVVLNQLIYSIDVDGNSKI